MKQIRKYAALLVAILMLLATVLSSCGKPETPTTAPVTEAPTESSTEKPTEPPTQPTENAPAEEFELPKEAGKNQLSLYWHSDTADYSKCDVWMWWDGADGRGYEFHPSAYGVKCVVNVPEDVAQVGFIVRKECSDPCGTSWGNAVKDWDGDRFAVITGEETHIYLVEGEETQYGSTDGGKTLQELRVFASCGIISLNEIQYAIAPAMLIESLSAVHVYEEGKEVPIASLSSLNSEVEIGIIETKEPLDIRKNYSVTIDGFGTAPALPTKLFDSPEFIAEYVYDGDDLGAVIGKDGKTTFKVWAPTASKVVLNLFEAGDGGDAFEKADMVLGDKGVWSYTADCGHGTYYTYSVTTAAGTQDAVDPYAKAAGVNGERGMVIDLASTDPDGFRKTAYDPDLDSYQDAVIWEVHVRDFSNKLAASKYPGKYLAFTETGLTNASGLPAGVDYLRKLDITHVHLQPVYDYQTVDETHPEDQFNWGYDPKNYNVPDGSYSTDPYHGEVRVNEFKQMVKALHENGIGVVMDVVYNHTYDGNSNLNKIVPYYYYRYTKDGKNSNGSGCGNETASERAMFRKYMVDSVTYWLTEYDLDGFRFDLMALHDVDTMQAVETAVHTIKPKALIYGEGWTGGATTLPENRQMTQRNASKITWTGDAIGGIAVFNDTIRDGLKGSVFEKTGAGYINGEATKTTAKNVMFGLSGAENEYRQTWSSDDQMVINYMSCHDNNTLWDKLHATCPDAAEEELLKMNRLGAAAVMFAKGTPFFLAGEEMLRTKQGDSNSYNSSDEINNIDWDALTPDSEAWKMANYYAELISVRENNSFIKEADQSFELLDGNAIECTWSETAADGSQGKVLGIMILNPADTELKAQLPEGKYKVLTDSDEGSVDGSSVTVPAKAMVFVVPQK
ncbi:MAG: type I pullulanase [Lachnospiraceae bacterium]|nr:type I pullulanase [Lachnospiraceae bacterium]